jgi:hypothetical protein
LQALIQKLAASGSQSTSSATDSTSAASSTDSALTHLEQSFQNLVSAVGGTNGSATTLNHFLSALAGDMSDRSSVGNLVSTQA